MLKAIKLIKGVDWLIFVLLVWRMARIDFDNVWYTDLFCLTAFVIWFGQLIVRIYLQMKAEKNS